MISAEKIPRGKSIPEEKTELVKELIGKITNHRTVLIASCKSLPGKQFHEIKKKLRGKAEIKVAKKSIIGRAIDGIDKGYIKNLKAELKADIALFFSDLDAFELSGLLTDNQSPARAKAGDISPEDIDVEPGPTELLPGPAISELSGVGLKVAVKEGKLEIMQGAKVAKKGEPIKANVAGVLSKLNITPMRVGFIPLAAYDSKDDKVYVGIKIDKKGTLEELRNLVRKALGFAIKVEYPTKKTIAYFIAKAANESKALEKLTEVEKSDSTETPAEEVKAEESNEAQNTDSEKQLEQDLNNQDTKEEA